MEITNNITVQTGSKIIPSLGIVASGLLKSLGLTDDYAEILNPFLSEDPDDSRERTGEPAE